MWAETVDPSDLHNTVWPRAAAVAEVLWTPLDVIYPNGIAAGELLFLSHFRVWCFFLVNFCCIARTKSRLHVKISTTYNHKF